MSIARGVKGSFQPLIVAESLELSHRDDRRGPLDQGESVEQPVTLNLGKPDGSTHTLSLLLDGKRSGDYTHDYGQVCHAPPSADAPW
jgi:hypothetical protein